MGFQTWLCSCLVQTRHFFALECREADVRRSALSASHLLKGKLKVSLTCVPFIILSVYCTRRELSRTPSHELNDFALSRFWERGCSYFPRFLLVYFFFYDWKVEREIIISDPPPRRYCRSSTPRVGMFIWSEPVIALALGVIGFRVSRFLPWNWELPTGDWFYKPWNWELPVGFWIYLVLFSDEYIEQTLSWGLAKLNKRRGRLTSPIYGGWGRQIQMLVSQSAWSPYTLPFSRWCRRSPTPWERFQSSILRVSAPIVNLQLLMKESKLRSS